MKPDEFRKYAHELVEWMTGYMENVEDFPVKSQVSPGDIFSKIPDHPPANPESFDALINDLNNIILPGITHWQSPNFFAYFPANVSPPSILAEMLISALGAQCMIWETSPAAAELEEKVMNWLREMIGLPQGFEGVIQDTASTCTLAAILTAREKITDYSFNETGNSDKGTLRVYCSEQAHSSVDKAVKISGIGKSNLVKIPVMDDFSMNPEKLREAIIYDKRKGFLPACVVATIGTTGTCAIDPIRSIGEICRDYGIHLHVDAAMGGTALILPEFHWMTEGKEYIDSFVFNPHKWMFTNFDCSAYFVKDAGSLIKTFEILPEYLKTRTRGKVNDYRDWGVPLGRRFRALKLWSVIRSYGVEGLQNKIREHIKIASELKLMVEQEPDFELLAPPVLPVVCFRYYPAGYNEDQINKINETVNHRLNDSGRIYLTHTVLRGKYTLRMVTAQTNVNSVHVRKAWELIIETARSIKG